MKINTFFYSIQQGLKNIIRNRMFSLASTATMAACIFMFGLFFILISNIGAMVKDAEEDVAVTVFFEEGISDTRIKDIGEEIKKRTEVKKINFVSAEEAWDWFSDVYFEGNEEAASGFSDNPLANSANYEVYVNDISTQTGLVAYLESIDGVREVKQSQSVADTLTEFNKILSLVSGGIILILLCVAIFLINNTITVGIAVRKEEIAIMKLIGATDFLVRAPFVVEGIVIGLIGAIIPLGVLYVLYDKIMIYIAEQFNFIGSLLEFVSPNILFQTLIPIALVLGVGIGLLGSMWTIRKHLRV
ncbi:MAG: permease-like cell division protein FtsX [Lachnospiraceae bacterium]|nr:permease-like cell division protein FtsX [Lachnospiraceae bacterium]